MGTGSLGLWQRNVRAIVFDMDGVVVDSSAIHAEAFRQALEPLGVVFEYSDYAGMRTREAIEAIASANGVVLSSQRLQELADLKTAMAVERLRRETPLAPQAREVLDRLHRSYPLALATSASEATVRAVIEDNLLKPYFRHILTGADCRNPKPSPDIYLRAAELLGLPPQACLVVEDSMAGITAAKAAGAICAAVSGTVPMSELRRSGADVVLTGISELMAL